MNYIRQQLAYASVVKPQGDVVPAWRDFLQARVNQEALEEWGKNPDPALPLFFSEKPTPVPLLRSLIGILP